MESAADLLHIFAEALALFAKSLDDWFHVSWPVPFALLLIPIVAVLDVVVWSLRGRVFRLCCGYYPTKDKKRCERKVFGEWSKCHDHDHVWTRADGHTVDPEQRRWEVQGRGEGRALDVQGSGLLSLRSRRDTLLYCQGFARWPKDVRKGGVFTDYKKRLISRWSDLKSLGMRGLFFSRDQQERVVATSPEVRAVVIPATKLTLELAVLGLVLVGVSTMVSTPINALLEYCASFAFTIALAVSRAGIGRAESRWLVQSLTEAGRWIAGLTGIAVLTGLVELYGHEAVDILKTIVKTLFTAFVFALVVYLLYRYGTKEKTKTSRKKRASPKRRRKRK